MMRTFRPFFLLSIWLGTLLHGAPQSPSSADVVVIGATPAGVAAAIAARRGDASVVLVEPSAHVGGRLAEALGFDEQDRMAPATVGGLWSELRARVDTHYGRGVKNPEPRVCERLIESWLAEAGVVVVKNFEPSRFDKTGARLGAVRATDGRMVAARVFVDATYMGDALPLAGATWTLERESRERHGESLAGVLTRLDKPPGKIVTDIFRSPISGLDDEGRPLPHVHGLTTDVAEGSGDSHLQCANLLLCLTRDPANRVEWTEPKDYDPAEFELLRREFARTPNARYSLGAGGVPNGKNKLNDGVSVLLHWGLAGGADEWPTATSARRREIWERHRDYTHRLFWFLLNDPAVPARVRDSIAPWGLAKDEFADNDHWPWTIYAREGRRLVGAYVITQRDLFDDVRKSDAVAIGNFPVDSHVVRRLAEPSGQGVVNEGGYLVEPPIYDIPYRALLPRAEECENLIVPVALSCSRVAYNSLRVEPTWMATGTVAGVAAALASREAGTRVHDVSVEALRPRLLELRQPLAR